MGGIMERKKNFSAKQFVGELKNSLKGRYAQSLGALLGVFVISAVVFVAALYLIYWAFRSLMYSVTLLMYGMATTSSLLLGVLMLLVALVIYVLVTLCVRYLFTAITFNFQDVVRNDDKQVGLGTMYRGFKHVRKLQILRLWLWLGLFLFLWQIVPDIVAGFFGSSKYVALAFRLVGLGITIWKSVEYSQSLFLYREKQPEFLGQSLRHALTASRRFMGGRKWNYIWLMIVVIVPLILWTAIWSGITYYGVYTWIPAIIYVAPIILVLGLWAYLPVLFTAAPLYYEMNRANVDVDETFTKTFLPEEKLVQQDLAELNRQVVQPETSTKKSVEPDEASAAVTEEETKTEASDSPDSAESSTDSDTK